MIGQCKLCLEENVELQLSHFLPRSIYKIIRDDTEKNPNPWLLTESAFVQTSRQKTAHLLCSACEERFNKNGENWVLKHCLREDGSFRLASLLAAINPDISSAPNPTKIYYASNITKIDRHALAYFGASMFWRASIHSWNDDGSVPIIMLGSRRERFRRYLMGKEAFPKNCYLHVIVREGKVIDRLTYLPAGRLLDGYRFVIPGLAFLLVIGKRVPDTHRNFCFVHGRQNPISVTPILENELLREVIGMRQWSLAERFKSA